MDLSNRQAKDASKPFEDIFDEEAWKWQHYLFTGKYDIALGM